MSFKLERETRLELATPTWQGRALPTELFPHSSSNQLILDFIIVWQSVPPFDALHSTSWRDESTIFFTTFDRLLKIARNDH